MWNRDIDKWTQCTYWFMQTHSNRLNLVCVITHFDVSNYLARWFGHEIHVHDWVAARLLSPEGKKKNEQITDNLPFCIWKIIICFFKMKLFLEICWANTRAVPSANTLKWLSFIDLEFIENNISNNIKFNSILMLIGFISLLHWILYFHSSAWCPMIHRFSPNIK